MFSISSLGELTYTAFVAAVCVHCTEYSVADYAAADDDNVNLCAEKIGYTYYRGRMETLTPRTPVIYSYVHPRRFLSMVARRVRRIDDATSI